MPGLFGKVPNFFHKSLTQIHPLIRAFSKDMKNVQKTVRKSKTMNARLMHESLLNTQEAIESLQASLDEIHKNFVEEFNAWKENFSSDADDSDYCCDVPSKQKLSRIIDRAPAKTRIKSASYKKKSPAAKRDKNSITPLRKSLRQSRDSSSMSSNRSWTPLSAAKMKRKLKYARKVNKSKNVSISVSDTDESTLVSSHKGSNSKSRKQKVHTSDYSDCSDSDGYDVKTNITKSLNKLGVRKNLQKQFLLGCTVQLPKVTCNQLLKGFTSAKEEKFIESSLNDSDVVKSKNSAESEESNESLITDEETPTKVIEEENKSDESLSELETTSDNLSTEITDVENSETNVQTNDEKKDCSTKSASDVLSDGSTDDTGKLTKAASITSSDYKSAIEDGVDDVSGSSEDVDSISKIKSTAASENKTTCTSVDTTKLSDEDKSDSDRTTASNESINSIVANDSDKENKLTDETVTERTLRNNDKRQENDKTPSEEENGICTDMEHSDTSEDLIVSTNGDKEDRSEEKIFNKRKRKASESDPDFVVSSSNNNSDSEHDKKTSDSDFVESSNNNSDLEHNKKAKTTIK